MPNRFLEIFQCFSISVLRYRSADQKSEIFAKPKKIPGILTFHPTNESHYFSHHFFSDVTNTTKKKIERYLSSSKPHHAIGLKALWGKREVTNPAV